MKLSVKSNLLRLSSFSRFIICSMLFMARFRYSRHFIRPRFSIFSMQLSCSWSIFNLAHTRLMYSIFSSWNAKLESGYLRGQQAKLKGNKSKWRVALYVGPKLVTNVLMGTYFLWLRYSKWVGKILLPFVDAVQFLPALRGTRHCARLYWSIIRLLFWPFQSYSGLMGRDCNYLVISRVSTHANWIQVFV